MSYFAAKVCYYDEKNKQNQMAYHIVAAKTMSDAVQRLANYYDEPNILADSEHPEPIFPVKPIIINSSL